MVSWTAPWRSTDQYQTIGTLYSQKESIRWYWRFISQIAVYMILGGYLILPTTFYGDPNKKLRYNKGVLAIIIVALLTGGYSLTALVWFACPPTLFRIDHIFIPVFSVSLFAFFATCYALASSSEYDFSNPAAPTTLALTLASALIYGVFALMLRRGIKKQRAMHRESLQHAQNPASAAAANWHASNSYPAYDPHAISSPHARSPSTAYDPYAARSIASLDGNSMMTMTPHTAQAPSEEELVKKQMAKLLTRPDLGLHNNSSRSTFHLDWTPGEEPDVELEGSSAVRQHGRSDSNQLTVPTTGRKRSQSAGNMLSSSSMQHNRGTREDRRREIEMANLSSRR